MESAGTSQGSKQTLRGCTIMMMPKMLSIEQHTPPVGSPRTAAMSAPRSIASAPWWVGRRVGGYGNAQLQATHSHRGHPCWCGGRRHVPPTLRLPSAPQQQCQSYVM